MDKIRTVVLCAIFCLSFLSLSFPETIILKSGQKVEGKIIEQTDKYVKLEFQGLELIFYSDEISSLEQSPEQKNTAIVQMESLYKAYTLARNAPPPSNKEETSVVAEPVLLGKAQTEQVTPVIQPGLASSPALDLSGLSTKEQERVKSMVANIKKLKQE